MQQQQQQQQQQQHLHECQQLNYDFYSPVGLQPPAGHKKK